MHLWIKIPKGYKHFDTLEKLWLKLIAVTKTKIYTYIFQNIQNNVIYF